MFQLFLESTVTMDAHSKRELLQRFTSVVSEESYTFIALQLILSYSLELLNVTKTSVLVQTRVLQGQLFSEVQYVRKSILLMP